MKKFAGFAEEAEVAIEKGDTSALAELMEDVRSNVKISETNLLSRVNARFQNFSLRRNLYGDACIGRENLRMIDIGQKFGAACKFPGTSIQGVPSGRRPGLG